MAHSLPLILYNFSGSDDQVNSGKNGYIVEQGDIESMVDKSLYIYQNDLVTQFGQESYKLYKEKFNEIAMIEGYVALIKKVMNR